MAPPFFSPPCKHPYPVWSHPERTLETQPFPWPESVANLRLHTIITPDNPDASYLIWKLEGVDDLGNPLTRMP